MIVVAIVLVVWTVLGFGATILFGRTMRSGRETDRPHLYLDQGGPEEIEARNVA